MKVVIEPITIRDIQEFNNAGMDGESISLNHIKLIATDPDGNTAFSYMERGDVKKLGHEYIETHCQMRYSEFFARWEMFVPENAYYNDHKVNPPRTIQVEFVEEKCGENSEVWRDVNTGIYFLRMLCNEPFAKWVLCHGRAKNWGDICEVKPNTTFQNGCQTESVRYDDWNDVGAYSELFNPDFRNGGQKDAEK